MPAGALVLRAVSVEIAAKMQIQLIPGRMLLSVGVCKAQAASTSAKLSYHRA